MIIKVLSLKFMDLTLGGGEQDLGFGLGCRS
jgi:hypothetical protein